MEFTLENRCAELRTKIAKATNLEDVATLTADLRRAERCIEVETKAHGGFDNRGRQIKPFEATVGESDVEFRARAERELAKVVEA